MDYQLIESLVTSADTRIVFLLLDGLGGLPTAERGGTELQAAVTSNLDALARRSVCGLLDPIGPGITPGSGPAHFALFGYDPVENNVGRGLLEGVGIGLQITPRDLVARINFATIARDGTIADRRAGRIDTAENERLCAKLREGVDLGSAAEFQIMTVKEHRAMVLLRAEGLSGDLKDTDPQREGLKPLPAAPLPGAEGPEADRSTALVNRLYEQACGVLSDEPRANSILLRGFARSRTYRTLEDRFALRPYAIAGYPMYRGVASLIGMKLHPVTPDVPASFKALAEVFDRHDFFFVHVKPTDSRGEDGDFDGKREVIEEVDRLLPMITDLKPDLLVVTGDHSTPSQMKAHSWHPVPLLLHSPTRRPDAVERFDEIAVSSGGLGRQPMVNLMGLALAHAGRLNKFGA